MAEPVGGMSQTLSRYPEIQQIRSAQNQMLIDPNFLRTLSGSLLGGGVANPQVGGGGGFPSNFPIGENTYNFMMRTPRGREALEMKFGQLPQFGGGWQGGEQPQMQTTAAMGRSALSGKG